VLNEVTIEKRLVTLEQTVAGLQHKLESKLQSKTVPENWLDKLIGSISDEAAFVEALEYGRSFRQADQPLDEVNKQM
jgi:hypothetical protein